MNDAQIWFYALSALAVLNLALLALLLVRARGDDGIERLGAALREDLRLWREDGHTQSRSLREELAAAHARAGEQLLANINRLGGNQQELLDGLTRTLHESQQRMLESINALGESNRRDQQAARESITTLNESNRRDQQAARESLEQRFAQIQASNEKKLDEMRQTVDEKLQGTLEKRLGESFRQVSERLEAVQRGLGEMKLLADGVGDLKRVLTNVKERGTWGEYQLAAILEQVLTPEQYAPNVRPKEGGETVEFAIRLPGRGEADGAPVWLPIDAKFPKEDYERLLDASAVADVEAVRLATAALAAAVKKSARDIHDKYIAPPATTDFAILFLPTEGLYAEVLRQPGLADELHTRYRVLVAGPTTLAAILNSLRVGFRTLAIEQRSHEVWSILGAVKAEFGKFGEVLDKVKKQLASASNTIESAERRTRAMTRKLRDVEQLPESEVTGLLGVLPAASTDESSEETEESA